MQPAPSETETGADAALLAAVATRLAADPLVAAALDAAEAAAAALPPLTGWRIVSGSLYQALWNAQDGRPSGYGVRDVDLFYHDATDLSWEAEDAVIRAAAPFFERLARPVEIRNQARVHLWYGRKFGGRCPAYVSSEHAIDHFASQGHALGLRREPDGRLDLYAPYGVQDILARRIRPNRILDNGITHNAKAARAQTLWPGVAVEPW